MSKIDEVLEFWFEKEDEPFYEESRDTWFAAEPGYDQEIRDRFMETYEEALEGKLDRWLDHPRGARS